MRQCCMIPNEEVQSYFFFPFDDPSKEKKKFDAVKIYDTNVVFPIRNHRIHVPDKFSIGSFDVTQHWIKLEDKWEKSCGKTDLSYSQIINAIEYIKNTYLVTDAQIAQLQFSNLSRSMSEPMWITELPSLPKNQIIIFLDYLNALMFGVEASGLNAALLTSAMTLDLIAESVFSYKQAFKANNDGGIYPYACYGDNKGTYHEREKAMTLSPPSMRTLRDNPKLSPVAIKEALLIKTWLKHSKVLNNKLTYEEQLKLIHSAIDDLCTFSFSPWVSHCYSIEKFKKCSDTNQTESNVKKPFLK